MSNVNPQPPAGGSYIPPGSAVTTPEQMLAEIHNLGLAQQDTNAKIDNLADVLNPALTEIRSDVADHETRLRTVERRIWQATGGIGALSVIGSAAVAFFGH